MASKQAQTFAEMIAPSNPEVQKLATGLRALARKLVPDAVEEIDTPAKMLVYTFIPGTYKGAAFGLALQKNHVNIMFGKGVELMKVDRKKLLEGTGKLARHIKITSLEQVNDPAVAALIQEAVARTPRSR